MKIKPPLRSIIIAVLIVGILGAGYYFFVSPYLGRNNPKVNVADNSFGWKYPVAKFPSTGTGGDLAYSNIRDPGGVPQGLPVRLKIPIINVDSAIEDALITPDGRMDVPSGSVNVAWFSLGPHPGQTGSAVVGGHFGIQNGVPFVFYNLDKLRIGDKIYILNDKRDTLTFAVRSIRSFDRNADATTVFTSKDDLAHLNLITCEGIWNQVNGTYPQRLVIFTDLIPSEGAVPGAASTFFLRSLGIGDTGPDVVALQTILEEKGFLTMPPKITKGFFGVLTSVAIAHYQASVGLPRVGVLGPLTIAKLNGELGSNPVLPNTGTEGVTASSGVTNLITLPQPFAEFVKSLFGNLIDGLITFFLLLSVIVMAFKVIRR